MKIQCLAAACAVVLAWGGLPRASGAMLFSDNFSSSQYTAGGSPPSALGSDGKYDAATSGIIGKNGGGSPWIAGEYTSNPSNAADPFGQDAYVVANPLATATHASGVANTSPNALALVGDSSGGPVHPSEIATDIAYDPTKSVTLSVDLMFPSSNASPDEAILSLANTYIQFGNYGYYSGHDQSAGPYVTFENDGGFAGTLVGPGVSLAADAWHNITVVYNPTNDTESIWIDGSSVAVLADSNMDLTYSKFNVFTDGALTDGQGEILMDNVSISGTIVPEPALGGIWGLPAVAGALLRRR